MGTFTEERALEGALSGHCETSRRIVDSSIQDGQLWDHDRGQHGAAGPQGEETPRPRRWDGYLVSPTIKHNNTWMCEGIDGSSLQSDPEKLKVVEQFAKEENVMEVLFYWNKNKFYEV